MQVNLPIDIKPERIPVHWTSWGRSLYNKKELSLIYNTFWWNAIMKIHNTKVSKCNFSQTVVLIVAVGQQIKLELSKQMQLSFCMTLMI